MKCRLLSAGMVLLLCVLLFVLPCLGLAEEENLIINGSFELVGDDGIPAGWYSEAWFNQEGYTTYSVSQDHQMEGSLSAQIHNFAENDARFAQNVEVDPESMYCLSGWIRTEDVSESGRGANLSIEGVYSFSESIHGSGTWTYVELYGETGEDQHEVTVFARLGGYSGESSGEAWFDDISLRKVNVLPQGANCDFWFTMRQPAAPVQDDTDEPAAAAPFWPKLLILSVLYMLIAVAFLPHLRAGTADLSEKRRKPWALIAAFVLSFVFQLLVGCSVEGYQVDVNCFLSWGNTMAEYGASNFYQTTSFCDYPPVYLYVLGLNGAIGKLLNGILSNASLYSWIRPLQVLTYKFLPILANLLMAAVLYRFALSIDRNADRAQALAILMAWNPALILNSAAWCQMDSVLCLLLLLVVVLALRRRWLWLIPVYMLSVLVKPQALMFGPLGLIVLVSEWICHRDQRRSMLIGTAIAVIEALLLVIPFSLHQSWEWLITLYGNTMASYPYATVNTANYYYLFGGNWDGVANAARGFSAYGLAVLSALYGVYGWKNRGERKWNFAEPVISMVFAAAFTLMGLLHVSWAVIGVTAMVMAFAIVIPLYLRAQKLEYLPLCGGILLLLLFVIGVKMHERYIFPALAFFALAYAIRRDWRIPLILLVSTLTLFVNEGIVLDNSLRLGSSMGHLNADTDGLNCTLAVLNVLLVPLALWTGFDLCVLDRSAPSLAAFEKLIPQRDAHLIQASKKQSDPSLHWKRLDTILMLAVTIVYSVVALWNLGSTKAPQNPWKSSDITEQVTIDLGKHYDGFYMLYFAQVSYNDFSVAVSDDGENWSDEQWAEMAQGQCFRWKYACDYDDHGGDRTYYSQLPHEFSGRYVRISAQQIGLILDEVIFRDSTDGLAGPQIVPAQVTSENGNADSPLFSDPKALLDEQDTLDGEPSWYNSTYFDEIYHARTAFEHMNGTVPYETTHPPLGKVIMSWCVALFGMTPFGWRFAGCMIGILMLPAMYLLGKQMTKRSSMAFLAMSLLALDCMHLTQTRIATIDSFPVLFIILAFFFMLRFMQRDILHDKLHAILLDLGFSGFFMGCSIASKWIGCYAGAGLAILYFWKCCRVWNISRKDTFEKQAVLNRLLLLCAFCILAFVIVPLVIYLLSYIPYFRYMNINSLKTYLERVIQAQINMFNYHSTPGLGMDHPYYSPWYEWPLIKKPMYYANPQYMSGDVSYSIFCFGNPAVWLTGLAGMACVLLVWFKRHLYRTDRLTVLNWQSSHDTMIPAFVLIGLLAQFLPWVLVPRGTYIYHYFASVPFLCLGTMLMFHWLTNRWPKAGKILLPLYLTVCLVLFIAFYPYASGTTVPRAWLDFMKQFLRIYY